MNFEEYQSKAKETMIYPASFRIIYPTLGLTGEAGEVSEKVKKLYRDYNGILTQDYINELKKELGDVLWYIAALSTDLGISMDEVAELNIQKLSSRQKRNALGGNGDNR